MKHISGFTCMRKQHIPELNTQARIFRHSKTGAESILSLDAFTPPIHGGCLEVAPQLLAGRSRGDNGPDRCPFRALGQALAKRDFAGSPVRIR